MEYVLLIGRILFSAIFIISALMGHFSLETIAYASDHGVPAAALLVPLSGLVALAGGLSVLLGYKARKGAWLLVIFLVPMMFMMHHFWSMQDAGEAMLHRAMFMKNLSMVGAALIIAYFGSGPMSLDQKPKKRA